MESLYFIYNQENIAVNESGEEISIGEFNFSADNVWVATYSLMTEDKKEYLSILTDFSFNDLMEQRLSTAYEFKRVFPQYSVYFFNEDHYYQLPVNEQGYSEITPNFDIAQHILLKGEKHLRVMFDWEATGLWDYRGRCIPLEWVPISENTRQLVAEFQKGLNKQRIIMDDSDAPLSEEEEEEIALYDQLALNAAYAIKKELPDWTIEIYNKGLYELPYNEYGDIEIVLVD